MHGRARVAKKNLTAIAAAIILFVAAFCILKFIPQEKTSFAYSYDDTAVFCVRSDEDFATLSDLSAVGKDFTGKTVLLYSDVTAPPGDVFTTAFNGVFNGNGFAIKGLGGTLFSSVKGEARSFYLTDVSVSNKPLIAKRVYGLLKDVDVYGSLSEGSVAEYNYGTIENVACYVTVNGGYPFVYANSGKIETCFLSGTYEFEKLTSEEIAGRATPYVGTIATLNYPGATVKNSVSSLKVSSGYDCEVYPFGAGSGGTSAENVGVILSLGEKVTVADGESTPAKNSFVKTSSVTVYDGSGAVGTDYSALGDGFYLSDGAVPTVKTAFGSAGTETDPFLIDDMHDVKRLVFAISERETHGGFYAKLTGDVFGTNFSSGTDETCVGTVKLTVDGNGHIFAKTDFDPFENVTLAAAVTVVSGFGGDGYTSGTFTGVTPSTVKGSGTETDPYIVTDAESLAAVLLDGEKNAPGKKAVVTKDILLNNVSSGNKVLCETAPDVKLDVDFTGHALVNTYLAPFGKIYGSISDLTVILSDKENLTSGVCASVENGGSLERINVFSLSNNVFTSGFTANNDGSISLSNSFVNARYAFCETNGGSIENCSSVSGEEFYSSGDGTIAFCVANGYRINGKEETRSGSGYYDLEADGFDADEVFGYEVGKSETRAEIRRKGVSYRVNAEGYVTINDDPNLRSFGYDENGYSARDVAESVYQTEEGYLRFDWTYGGEPYTAENLTDAGEYVLAATAYGDNLITTELEPITVVIIKSVYDGTVEYSRKGDKSFDYVGAEITDEPEPDNYALLKSKGFVLSFAVTKNGVVSAVRDCGTYVQTISLSSDNYETITYTRKITINKIPLTVSVADDTIVYGSAYDVSSFGADMLIMTGTVGTDREKTSKLLTEESGFVFANLFSVEYAQGDDVGEYAIKCSLKYLDNYLPTVSAGVLRVTKAEFSGITFSGGTFVYDGTAKSLYVDGQPSGAKVEYEGNGEKNAGVYSVRATVLHKNYETKTYLATLTITKATIKITVSDAEKQYGYEFNSDDFDFTAVVPVKEDDFKKVTEFVTIEAVLKNPEEKLIAGKHEVTLSVTGEAENYVFAVTNGYLTIGKASLTAIYPKTEYKDVFTEYTGQPLDYAIPSDAFGNVQVSVAYKIISGGKEVSEIKEVGYYTVTATVTPLGDDENNFFVTEYSFFAEITLITTKIVFEKASYEFVYDGSDKATEEYVFFTEKMPEDAQITVYFTQNGVKTKEVIHAGDYVVTAEFSGDGNFASARATATVTVKARSAILTVAREYVYNGKAIVPAVTISYPGGGSGGLTASDISYRFTNSIGMEFNSVAEAETYKVVATSKNPDYEIVSGECEIVISPLAATIALSDVSFQYGAYGEYTTDTYDGTVRIGSGEIAFVGYEVAETGLTETIKFAFKSSAKYFTIGEYTVSTEQIVQPKNYRFTLSKSFTLTVTRRALSVVWKVDGKVADAAETAITYAGRDQSERITYTLSGFASGESESSVTVRKVVRQGIYETELIHADKYIVSLTISGAPNYVFDGTEKLGVIVNKSPLNGIRVYIPGGEVRQYENIPSAEFVIDGLKGDDAGKNPYLLKGFSFVAATDYNPITANEGDIYSVSGRFTFDDYTIESGRVEKGSVTVIKGYKSYSMADATFVYDGTEKTITVKDVEEGVRIEYTNNVHRDAGRYTVTANVIYPTGRTSGISATMTITKGTPVVTTEDEYTVYVGAKTLTSGDVKATAYFNEIIPSVPGTVTFIGTNELRRGTNTFNLLFTPTDSKNLNEVRFTKKITVYEVTGASLTFSHSDYTVDTDNKLFTETVLEVYVDKTPYVGVEDDLGLYQNGISVRRATFNRTAKEKIEIRYKQTTIFKITYDVTFGQKPSEDKPEVKVDERLLEISGISFSDDGNTIYLSGEAGLIKMKEEYKDAYSLYIDGVLVEESYTLRKGVDSINVEIRNKKLSVTQYSKKITVTTEKKPDIVPTDDGKKGFKTYYYYIIAAGGALLVAGIVVLILKLRK